MQDYWLMEAVSNNAEWCDAMAVSHDIATKRDESVWSSEHPMPSFYPNIVTLRRGVVVDKVIDSISPQLSAGWGVKDSFGELNLESRGFKLAFEARWYCCLPGQNLIIENSQKIQVKRVKNQAELKRWVDAWGDGDGIFNPSLVRNSAIELLYVELDGEVVAGVATNESSVSIGISNSFGRDDMLIGCIATVIEKNPLKGIVGYGDKAEITALSKIDFKEIGDLKVWLRT